MKKQKKALQEYACTNSFKNKNVKNRNQAMLNVSYNYDSFFYNKKGITLVSLVITIIVLLILAAISISMLTGNNGILTKTKQSQTKTEDAEIQEKLKLAISEAQMQDKLTDNDGKINKADLEKALNNNGTISGDGPFLYDDGKDKYIINEDGSIAEYFETDVLKVGDYVNYTYDSASNYETNKLGADEEWVIGQDKNVKWRILDVSATSIKLISANPTNQSVSMRSGPGYANGVNALNQICSTQYSNQELGVIARSIRWEDIYGLMNDYGKNQVAQKNQKTFHYESAASPALYVYENDGESNSKLGVSDLNPNENQTTNEETWIYNREYTVRQTYYDITDLNNCYENKDVYDMLFGNSLNGNYYWIASRYANIYNDKGDTMFGILSAGNNTFLNGGGLMYSTGYYQWINNRHMRPVVELNTSLLNNNSTKDNNGVWNLNK